MKSPSVGRKEKWFGDWTLGHRAPTLRGPEKEEPEASEEKRLVESQAASRGEGECRKVLILCSFLPCVVVCPLQPCPVSLLCFYSHCLPHCISSRLHESTRTSLRYKRRDFRHFVHRKCTGSSLARTHGCTVQPMGEEGGQVKFMDGSARNQVHTQTGRLLHSSPTQAGSEGWS